MKKYLAALVIMSAMIGLGGCNEDDVLGLDKRLVGTWQATTPAFYPHYRATFNADGSAVFIHDKNVLFSGVGVWYTYGSVLVVSVSGKDYSNRYTYTVAGKVLTLIAIDGYTTDFIKTL